MKRFLKPVSTKLQQADGRTLVKNSLARTELEQYKTYEYDSFNKATKVIVEDYTKGAKEVHIQRNFYDAENLRYGIEEDGKRTNFVTNGWSVFTELDEEWKPKKRLVRGYGIIASEEIDRSVEREPKSFAEIQNQKLAEKYHFYHQNEHGDTEYITGSNGEVTNAYTYDAFGTIINSRELVKNRYTYNGEPYDQISQQYYLRARNYNPLIGRFTQEDVYRGDGLNLYAYCGNNPVMYVDPSGYSEVYDPTTNLYPPRTKEAQQACEDVINIVNDKIITGTKNRNNSVISVFTHEDGTVSVGFSGESNSKKSQAFANRLQSELDKVEKNKYKVSAGISDTLEKRMESTSKGVPGNAIGDCAEPKAATAAHSNQSPITGMDTRHRLVANGVYTDNPHPYTGSDNIDPSQMDPCDTCKIYEKEYMEYANENKQSMKCDV